jgi:hypothetical protein
MLLLKLWRVALLGWFVWRRAWCILSVLLLSLISCSVLGSPACVILDTQSRAVCIEVVKSIEMAGGSVHHVFQPAILICDLSDSDLSSIQALPHVREVLTGPASSNYLSYIDPKSAIGLSVWNSIFEQPVSALSISKTSSYMPEGSALLEDDSPTRVYLQSSDSAPGYTETSSYMIGSIVVAIILPESAGDLENWTQVRIDSVVGEIMQGMDWWISHSEGKARMTVYYEMPPENLGAPCEYEPITLSYLAADAWIKSTICNLGYCDGDADGVSLTQSYINDIRSQYNTDWSFCVYVVDSLNDSDGCFLDGRCSFAYRNGPLVVMTYDCGCWDHSQMDKVFRHEVGHIFGAADEYCCPFTCCDFGSYGYLDVENNNCALNNTASVQCVMKDNSDNLCVYTRGQIGWRDSDGDGIFDPIDTSPECSATCLEGSSTASNTLHINGSAEDVPYPSPRMVSVTINKITSVQFNIDGGAWQQVDPSDGSYDSALEYFNFSIADVNPGEHTVNIHATNTVGNISAVYSIPITVAPDLTPPVMGTVYDDGRYTNDNISLRARWSATDPETGISEYKYAVGTSPADPGKGYTVDWMSNGSATSANISLDLKDGQTYYIYVKARNSNDIWSDAAASDGITAKITDPVGSIKKIGDDIAASISYKIVSAVVSEGVFYIEDDNRACGLRVESSTTVTPGDRVTVSGKMRTTEAGERYIKADSVEIVCHNETMRDPLGVNIYAAIKYKACHGILVRVWGNVGDEVSTGLWKLQSIPQQYILVRPAVGSSLTPGQFKILDGILTSESSQTLPVLAITAQ